MSADEFRDGNVAAMGRHALPYSATPQLTPWPLAAAPETSAILAPASTMRTEPVMNDESSPARYTQTPAIFSDLTNRRRGKLAKRTAATPLKSGWGRGS